MIYREIHSNFKLVWSKLHGPTLGKYKIQAARKSDQDFGTNTVENECSERTDKLGAELNLLLLSTELTWRGFGNVKV